MAYTKIYWRSASVPMGGLMLLALCALASQVLVEAYRRQETAAEFGVMVAAAQQTERGMQRIRALRHARRRIDVDVDPQDSGLIGVASSPVTSVSGHLVAKQTTVNPNWAAVAVKVLREVGVRSGDAVAVAASGSFPALNLAVYTALEQIGAHPVIILSGSASQWGANVPGLLWVDMARDLRKHGIIHLKAAAGTLGGREDRGIGISDRGREIIREAFGKAGIDLMEPASYDEAVAERIALYEARAGDRTLRTFVNVGGGTASTGPASIDQFFGSGIITTAPPRAFAIDSVMGHFLKEGVPAVSFSGIKTLAHRYGLPVAPRRAPPIGTGGVYETRTYRRWLAAMLIAVVLTLTFVVTHMSSVAMAFGRRRTDKRLEPTV